MTWIYNSANGNLSRNGELVGAGYSGCGLGVDNPALEAEANVGPIPRGTYTIGQFYTDPVKGPLVARLTPTPETNEYGRSGFLLHGDNQELDHTASHGCIIMARPIRQAVFNSGDNELVVA